MPKRKSAKAKEQEYNAKLARKERQAFHKSINNSREFKFNATIPKRNEHIKFGKINPATVPELLLAECKIIEDEELRERERKAKEISDARKKSVGIAYNKGAYQPIFDPKELGRK